MCVCHGVSSATLQGMPLTEAVHKLLSLQHVVPSASQVISLGSWQKKSFTSFGQPNKTDHLCHSWQQCRMLMKSTT